ncbi:MAG: DUF3488 and transglutaminase-like domain-containing protein [Opitutaceae bacterium]|nr:DUF3488 and transglutaminase-like domain-containing protein [Opitutaceae bacterium]
MSTESKRPQLSLDELRLLKWLLGGALALVSLWTVFFLDVEALSLVSLASLAVVAVLIWPQLPARVPGFVRWLSVPALIAVLVGDFYLSPETLPPLIRLAILLVLYRGVGYRQRREDLQLIVLGLFLIVVAGVLTVALGFAFLLLLFTACALVFLFVVTLIETKETGGGTADSLPATGAPAWTRLGWRRFFGRLAEVADWRLLAFAGSLFAVVVVLSGVLFLIIPRFEIATGFFLDRYITKKSRTGFTETIRFGDVAELISDETTALRVDFSDPAARPGNPYWRLVVLDEYSREGFKISAAAKAELLRSQRVTAYLRGRRTGSRAAGVGGQWTFYVEPGVSRFLPLPGNFEMLRLRELLPLQSSVSRLVVALRTEPMTMTAYRLEGVQLAGEIADVPPARPPTGRAAAAGRSETSALPQSLQLPAGADNREALQRVVAEIRGGEDGATGLPAEEFARRACAWLSRRHAYALSVTLPSGDKDDIVRWVESNQPGFCEYFAAAFTVLARAAGYPARVVAGFHGGTWNAVGNYYQIKNSDAHAWSEIHTGRGTWLRVDPTPGGGLADSRAAVQTAMARQGDRSWSARLDSLRIMWYRRVVSFDQRTQTEMAEQLKSLTADSGQAVRAFLDRMMARLRAWLAGPWNWARAGRVAGGTVLAGAFVWLIWRGREEIRWRWSRLCQRGRVDPVRREAGRWLARIGHRIVPAERQAVHAGIVTDLQRLRYGPRSSWPEPGAVFRRARREGGAGRCTATGR